MKGLSSLIIVFSMYSRIPMPETEWTKDKMEYAMGCFPFVGAVIGGLYIIYAYFAERLHLSDFSYACFGTVLPVLVTGGIHMDGFADTVDALSSCQTRERKMEILKDPHTGAFAVIGCCLYFLLYAGVFCEIPRENLMSIGAVPVISRAASGFSVIWFPKAKKSGLAAMFAEKSRKGPVTVMLAAITLAGFVYLGLVGGFGCVLACSMGAGVSMIYYYKMMKKQFGGITGDLAGFFLQISELIMMAALMAVWKMR